MPHALFLGSSLAGIDRLNMLPLPPRHPDDMTKTYVLRKLRAGLRNRKGKRSAEGVEGAVVSGSELELREMRPAAMAMAVPSLTGLAGPSVRVPPNVSAVVASGGNLDDERDAAIPGDGDGKDLELSAVLEQDGEQGTSSRTSEAHERDEAYRKAVAQYKQEMSQFDRIRWVTLHLWHASVRPTRALAIRLAPSLTRRARATPTY